LELVTKEIRTAFPVIRVVDIPVYSSTFSNPKGPSQVNIPKSQQTPQRLGGFEVIWITATELEAAKAGETKGGMYGAKDPRLSQDGPKGSSKSASPKLIFSKLESGRFPQQKEILNIIRAQIALLNNKSQTSTASKSHESGPQAVQPVDRYAQFSYSQERMVRKLGGTGFVVNQRFSKSKGIAGPAKTSTFAMENRGGPVHS
jgi:hypothetical protein